MERSMPAESFWNDGDHLGELPAPDGASDNDVRAAVEEAEEENDA